jgi:hypothetical protein
VDRKGTVPLVATQLERETKDYEGGLMDADDAARLFQELRDTGIVWHPSERYQRTAKALLEAGMIFLGRGEAAVEGEEEAFDDPVFLLLESQDGEGAVRAG